jgi:anti-sigma regulatory factor (Ser/Thr protein kinase)
MMAMTEERISFKLKNRLSELETLYRNLEQFGNSLGLSEKTIFRSKLALDELFTNIISYGYTNNDEHWIEITVSHENETLILRIEDEGIFFNPTENERTGLECSLEECEIGGLGIHITKHFMDDISYQRCGNKNVVTLKINLRET